MGRVKKFGVDIDGFEHRISSEVFTKRDEERFGVHWASQPCKAGGVRISMPQIPHGAKEPSSGERTTILPWFVGNLQDNEILEVLESGTRSLLATAHRDMMAPLNTPSGHPTRYGAVPFRFPAATELMNVSAISDALVGRRTWQ